MNTPTHTPGPWESVYMELLERKRTLANIEDLTEMQRARLAQVNTELDRHYALREAAPAMYEALKWAKQYLRMPNFHPDNSYNAEQWAGDYNKLCEALAQAEGRK